MAPTSRFPLYLFFVPADFADGANSFTMISHPADLISLMKALAPSHLSNEILRKQLSEKMVQRESVKSVATKKRISLQSGALSKSNKNSCK